MSALVLAGLVMLVVYAALALAAQLRHWHARRPLPSGYWAELRAIEDNEQASILSAWRDLLDDNAPGEAFTAREGGR